MKRATYHCDRCQAVIARKQGVTDWKGTHFGLCDDCANQFCLVAAASAGSEGFVVLILDQDDILDRDDIVAPDRPVFAPEEGGAVATADYVLGGKLPTITFPKGSAAKGGAS